LREIIFLGDGGNDDGIRSPVFRHRERAKIVTGSEGGFFEREIFSRAEPGLIASVSLCGRERQE
jgi:hypothetical protein